VEDANKFSFFFAMGFGFFSCKVFFVDKDLTTLFFLAFVIDFPLALALALALELVLVLVSALLVALDLDLDLALTLLGVEGAAEFKWVALIVHDFLFLVTAVILLIDSFTALTIYFLVPVDTCLVTILFSPTPTPLLAPLLTLALIINDSGVVCCVCVVSQVSRSK
jgi:hypothetical protein